VAAIGALVAFSGLRRQRDLAVAPGGERAVRSADLAGRSGELAVSGRELGGSDGDLVGCVAAPVAVPVREAARDSRAG
jgi:hypothetical protein